MEPAPMTPRLTGERRPRRVTGAWLPGDPPGHRRFFTLDRRFATESGAALSDVTIAYETWGTLDERATNAILLCHAWTGDSHVTGPAGARPPDAGLVGVDGRSRTADRHRPLVRRVRQRARRLPGLDRAGVDRIRTAARTPLASRC